MRRENSTFKTSFVSEAGSLPVNKDYFGYVEMDDFACYVVADGLENDRDISAAKLVTDYVLGNFTARPGLSKRRMKRYLREASQLLRKGSDRFRLKASVMVVMTDYMKIRYVMAGNTRLYQFRNQKILSRSKDQSFYQNDVNLGKIPDDQTREFEERSNLLEYLGQPRKLHPIASKKIKLQDNDILLLASCGLWEQLSDIEFIDALEACEEPENFVEDLQDMLLSKKKAEQYIGNYTAAAIYVNKVFKKADNRRKILRIVLAIGIPLLTIGIVIGIVAWRSNTKWKESKEEIIEIEQRADSYTNDLDYTRAQSEYAKAVEAAKELKQKNGKKGKENKAIKGRIDQKERISQLLSDGDQFLEDGSYSKALQSYQDAKKLLNTYGNEDIDKYDANSDDLQTKIDRCKTLVSVQQAVQTADLKAAAGDYDAALEGYTNARQAAIAAGESELEKDIASKQTEAQSQAAASIASAKKNEGMMAESAGDIALAAGDSGTAKSSYRQAAALYAAANYPEGVSSVNGKATQIDAKDSTEEAAAKADAEKEEQKLKEEQEKEEQQLKEEQDAATKAEETAAQLEEKDRLNALKTEARRKEAEGDRYAQNGDNQSAADAYQEAYGLYSDAGQSDMAQMAGKKLDAVQSKQEKEKTKLETTIGAEDWELLGDEQLKDLEYDTAIAYYQLSKTSYQETGDNTKTAAVEKKIQRAKSLKEIYPKPTAPVIVIVPNS